MAPRVGIEPTTNRLTGDRSTSELPRNSVLVKDAKIIAKLGYFAKMFDNITSMKKQSFDKKAEKIGLSPKEIQVLRKLNTPIKIQDFLDTLAINWEKNGDTQMSPRRVLREKKAHCLEGAVLAALTLWLHGQEAFILDLKAKGDDSHVVALYQQNGYWGAISKSNHATSRFRDPIFQNLRELALSYFHEYFNDKNGRKALISYSSKPFNLKKLTAGWVTAEKNLGFLNDLLENSSHTPIIPKGNKKFIRSADKMERKAGRLIEWRKTHSKT